MEDASPGDAGMVVVDTGDFSWTACGSNGDSGAPIVTNSGQLIGIHVVGNDPGNASGFCVLASSALQFLQRQVTGLAAVLTI